MPPDHPRFSRREFLSRSAMAVAGGALASCTGGGSNVAKHVRQIDTRWPIKRVIYLMLENRSFDHLFGRFPGVNGATMGVRDGKEVPLTHCPQWLPGDIPHDYLAALRCLNGGNMDGFATGTYGPYFSYTQYNEHALPNYYHWAREYVLCDNFYASILGPSYPNHFFAIAGQSGGTFDNPENVGERRSGNKIYKSWGCDATGNGVFVLVRDDHGNVTKHQTCFEFPTIGDQLLRRNIQWSFYAAQWGQPGYFWSAFNGVGHVFHTDLWHEHILPVDGVLADIERNALPSVTWITPVFQLSDHPPWSTCFAHNWVTSVVNAVMRGPMWKDTVLFLTWDECGGFDDHVDPPTVGGTQLGFRVPMLVIPPYSR